MRRLYPWVDTTGESGVYPIGDAVDVYRAALDLLYKEGDNRPAVIVVHDTIEGGGEKPCPVKCTYVWHHKSAMDTSTILAVRLRTSNEVWIVRALAISGRSRTVVIYTAN